MNKQYLYPLTAVICAALLGGSFLGVQINKQRSIEKQAQMAIDQENSVREAQELKEETLKISLEWCLDGADTAYWDYVELNLEEQDDGSYWGENMEMGCCTRQKRQDRR
jgi:hypothetical protein